MYPNIRIIIVLTIEVCIMSKRGKKKDEDIQLGKLRIKTTFPDIEITIPNLLIAFSIMLVLLDVLFLRRNPEIRLLLLGTFFGINLVTVAIVIFVFAIISDFFIDFRDDDFKEDRGIRALVPKRFKMREPPKTRVQRARERIKR